MKPGTIRPPDPLLDSSLTPPATFTAPHLTAERTTTVWYSSFRPSRAGAGRKPRSILLPAETAAGLLKMASSWTELGISTVQLRQAVIRARVLSSSFHPPEGVGTKACFTRSLREPTGARK